MSDFAAPTQRTDASNGVLVAGAVAVAAGLIGFATIGYWYAADMGWTGSGSTIVDPRTRIAVAAIVPAAAIAVGVATLRVRHHVPARSPGGITLAAVSLLIAASVVVAVVS